MKSKLDERWLRLPIEDGEAANTSSRPRDFIDAMRTFKSSHPVDYTTFRTSLENAQMSMARRAAVDTNEFQRGKHLGAFEYLDAMLDLMRQAES